jgi:hypothetical protein
MTRRAFIQRVRRQIYNGEPADDATITIGLVNNYLNDAIAAAAKANYKDNIAIDGISYVNNSFYTTFKDISISSDGNFTWKLTLPEIPVGIGYNSGISTLRLKDDGNNITLPLIPISQNQKTYYQSMMPIPNKVIYYYEGSYLFIKSTILLSQYTADVTMISGGDSTDLGSTLNVPPDYFPVMMQYLQQQLLLEKAQPLDDTNDGEDFTTTT